MNTHDIELPPMPEHDMCGEAYAYSNDAMQSYARAAIEADRQAGCRSAGRSRQHIGQLDRADLAFIYDELKQAGCERAASLVSRALSATPEPVIRKSRTTETLRWPGEFDGAHHVAEPRDLIMGRRK